MLCAQAWKPSSHPEFTQTHVHRVSDWLGQICDFIEKENESLARVGACCRVSTAGRSVRGPQAAFWWLLRDWWGGRPQTEAELGFSWQVGLGSEGAAWEGELSIIIRLPWWLRW